jgi:3-hydroxyisobutyrate dehydrogenase-like beta-hydroxyacid dehydrogenase
MTKLAFCGLGQMGLPMALRLVEAGHEVAVWNRTPERAGPAVERGARPAATPAEAAAGAEAAITMLAGPEALEAVVFAPGGLAEALGTGATLIDMSTVGPRAVRAVASRLPAGVGMIDAPVLGSIPQAVDGILKIFAGGPEDLCRRWFPVLQVLGTPRRVGPLGSGAAMKVVVNSTLVTLMCTLGEALALADGLGLEEAAVLDVLADSPIGVTVHRKRQLVESGRYPPSFRLALARKDAGLVTEAAAGAGVRAPVAEAAARWLTEALEEGLGDLDYSAVVAHIRGRPASGP